MWMRGVFVVGPLLTAGAACLAWSMHNRKRVREGHLEGPAAERDPDVVTHGSADRTVVAVDNGGRPFAVHISYGRRVATVCRVTETDTDDDPKKADEVLLTFRFRRVFVGLDPKEPEALQAKAAQGDTKGDGAPDKSAAEERAVPLPRWWHGGNSVLLDLGGGRYVFVGLVVMAFRTPDGDEVREYISTMGNSAVPYPYAVGDRNTYFMIEDAFIPNHVIKRFSPEDQEDPYNVLYSDELARWLPGADPRANSTKAMPQSLQAWQEEFPLPNREILVERQW